MHLEPKEFSNKIKEYVEIRGGIQGLDRSVFKLLSIGKGEDSREMMWQMLRLIKILEIEEKDVYDTLIRIQENAEDIKKYFFAMIIGIMAGVCQASLPQIKQTTSAKEDSSMEVR